MTGQKSVGTDVFANPPQDAASSRAFFHSVGDTLGVSVSPQRGCAWNCDLKTCHPQPLASPFHNAWWTDDQTHRWCDKLLPRSLNVFIDLRLINEVFLGCFTVTLVFSGFIYQEQLTSYRMLSLPRDFGTSYRLTITDIAHFTTKLKMYLFRMAFKT